MYISPNKTASKLINLFADNRITQNQWKFSIPDEITDESIAIVASAKNLADGINYSIERHGIVIPEELIVAGSEYKEIITNKGTMINGNQ
jgi:hypothetical protein